MLTIVSDINMFIYKGYKHKGSKSTRKDGAMSKPTALQSQDKQNHTELQSQDKQNHTELQSQDKQNHTEQPTISRQSSSNSSTGDESLILSQKRRKTHYNLYDYELAEMKSYLYCDRCQRKGNCSIAITRCNECEDNFCHHCIRPHFELRTYVTHHLSEIASDKYKKMYQNRLSNLSNTRERRYMNTKRNPAITDENNKMNTILEKMEIVGKERENQLHNFQKKECEEDAKIATVKSHLDNQLNNIESMDINLDKHKETIEMIRRKLHLKE